MCINTLAATPAKTPEQLDGRPGQTPRQIAHHFVVAEPTVLEEFRYLEAPMTPQALLRERPVGLKGLAMSCSIRYQAEGNRSILQR